MSDKIENEHNHQRTIGFLEKEFSKESDRAAVILVSSLFDEALLSILKTHLTPCTTSNDEMFEGGNAPLGTFSSRINISNRLGLISNKLARDLHLIRKIRNSFAHNVFGCTFENGSVRSRIDELSKSVIAAQDLKGDGLILPEGHKGEFLLISAYILYHLNDLKQDCEALKECELEDMYHILESKTTANEDED